MYEHAKCTIKTIIPVPRINFESMTISTDLRCVPKCHVQQQHAIFLVHAGYALTLEYLVQVGDLIIATTLNNDDVALL